MKSLFKYIAFASIATVFSLTSCDEDNKSNLQLSGDCKIEAFALDNYEGDIDLSKRTITVRIPETYETSAMAVTALKMSTGATASINVGSTLNMTDGMVVRVENGDVFLNWTIIAKRDQAQITSFTIDVYTGIIDEESKSIKVYVPKSLGVSSLTPSIIYSDNASIHPLNGTSTDFSSPITYTVTNGTAKSEYTVSVIAIDKPSALFVGGAPDMNTLDPEAAEACKWMLANISNSLYASFADIAAESVDLSDCKVIWWHYHKDGGVDGHDAFVANAGFALDAKNQLRSYYENGGSFFLTRYATNLPSFIGVTGDDEWTTPNNCWGQNEDAAELCGGPWTFRKFAGQENHPIYTNIVEGDNTSEVYCTDAGYHITNSTAQYHIGEDWGDYKTHDDWVARTNGIILGVGGDQAIVAWEYPANAGKGGVICIGSGCYDWHSYMFEASYTEKYHKNIEIMTRNVFNYLMKE